MHAAAAQQQRADASGVRRVSPGAHDRHAAIGLVELRDHGAVKGSVDGLQHIGRRQPVQRQLVGTHAHAQLRLARRHLEPHGAAFGHCRSTSAICAATWSSASRSGPNTLTKNGADLAGQRLADALDQHRVDFDQLVRKVIEYRAHPRLDLPA